VPNFDYALAYDTNSRIARLIPAQGLWVNGTYVITLDRGSDGIKDLAGNTLQENAPPATRFVVDLTDTIVSGWQNPTNRFDVDNDGRVNGRDLLWLVNRILLGQSGPLPLVATPPPYLDVTGDGALRTSDVLAVVNEILRNTAAPAAATADPLAATETPESSATPLVEPLVAPLAEKNSVAIGLAMDASSNLSNNVIAEASGAAVADAGASQSAPVAAPQTVAAAFDVVEPLAEGADDVEVWDADFDSIFTDLSGDLKKRVYV